MKICVEVTVWSTPGFFTPRHRGRRFSRHRGPHHLAPHATTTEVVMSNAPPMERRQGGPAPPPLVANTMDKVLATPPPPGWCMNVHGYRPCPTRAARGGVSQLQHRRTNFCWSLFDAEDTWLASIGGRCLTPRTRGWPPSVNQPSAPT